NFCCAKEDSIKFKVPKYTTKSPGPKIAYATLKQVIAVTSTVKNVKSITTQYLLRINFHLKIGCNITDWSVPSLNSEVKVPATSIIKMKGRRSEEHTA